MQHVNVWIRKAIGGQDIAVIILMLSYTTVDVTTFVILASTPFSTVWMFLCRYVPRILYNYMGLEIL